MSTSKHKPSETNSDNDTPKIRTEKKTARRSAPRTLHPMTALAFTLSLIALGTSGYIVWKNLALEQQVVSTRSDIEQTNNQLFSQSGMLASTRAELEPLTKAIQHENRRSEKLLVDISSLSAKVKALEGSARADSHLAEVEYLLRLANQRLLMSADAAGAEKLLRSADDILLNLDDYELFSIRKALAEDLVALSSIPSFDLEGTYTQLQALSGYIQSLPLLEPTPFSETKENPANPLPSPSTASADWQQALRITLSTLWENFTSLFRFTSDRNKALTEILTPEQEALVRQNLRLVVEQSKLALLAREEAIYKNSLSAATQWLHDYFVFNSEAVDAIRQELTRLSELNINPDLPNISRAIAALKRYRLEKPDNVQPKKPTSNNRVHLPKTQESTAHFSPPVVISGNTPGESEEKD